MNFENLLSSIADNRMLAVGKKTDTGIYIDLMSLIFQSVDLAQNLVDALKMFDYQPYDIIMINNMQGIDNTPLIRKIIEEKRNVFTLMIVESIFPIPDYTVNAKINPPIIFDELVTALEAFYNFKKIQNQTTGAMYGNGNLY